MLVLLCAILIIIFGLGIWATILDIKKRDWSCLAISLTAVMLALGMSVYLFVWYLN